MDTAKIVKRGKGWAIEVTVNGRTGFIGKAFEGVTIYSSFAEAQHAAQVCGYVVINPGPPKITNVDECAEVPVIETNSPAGILALAGVPLVGVITPQPDPVYGHTFKMPDVIAALGKHNGNGQGA